MQHKNSNSNAPLKLRLLLTSDCTARCGYCHNEGQAKDTTRLSLADITHVLLIHPRIGASLDKLRDALLGLAGTADGQPALDELGIEQGFEAMSVEDGTFANFEKATLDELS